MIKITLLNGQYHHERGYVQSRGYLSFVWASTGNGQQIKRIGRPGRGSGIADIEKESHPMYPILSKERKEDVCHLVGVCFHCPHNPSNIDLSAFEAFQRRLCAAVQKLNLNSSEVRIDNGRPFSTKYLVVQ